MVWRHTYKSWLEFEQLDPQLKAQLLALKNNELALEDAFYKHLSFGTAGIRGKMGPGTNRLNKYTIRKVTTGLAEYILNQDANARKQGVVIAYDSRHLSPEFALETARTLGKYHIQVYLFDSLRPTPLLSFAVRYLRAFSGIMLTASHNPPQYNGYKVYGNDGNQVTETAVEHITSTINKIDNPFMMEIPEAEELIQSGLLQMIGNEIDDEYLQVIEEISLNKKRNMQMSKQLSIVFSPLHGTATHTVVNGLKKFGFNDVNVVQEQAQPNGDFPTIQSPNPEEHDAFALAIRDGKKINADILLATDPDADRLGVAVNNDHGEYVVLTGNQTGALLLHYLLKQKQANGTLPKNGVILKTIVTSELGTAIANEFSITTIDLLTGFKYIGEKIREYEETGEYIFQFGYEESYGYLIHDAVRDKDAVQAACLVAEVAAFYKSERKTMYDGLLELFEKYGYFREDLVSLTLEGKAGAEKISKLLDILRERFLQTIGKKQVVAIEDYLTGERLNIESGETLPISLPKANVLKFFLCDDAWIAIRPSGTEPKIKFYFGVKEASMEEANQQLHNLTSAFMEKITGLLHTIEQPTR